MSGKKGRGQIDSHLRETGSDADWRGLEEGEGRFTGRTRRWEVWKNDC